MKIKVLLIWVSALQLGACSTIVNGTNQSIAFTTGAVEGAGCDLTGGSNRAVNESFTTPATIKVPRSGKAMNLKCSKSGYETAERLIDGTVEETTGGNLLLGGFIGAGVDAATGAIYKYPDTVDLPMQALGAVTAAEPIAE